VWTPTRTSHAEAFDGSAQRQAAAHGARRSVEGSEQAIAGGVELAAAEASQAGVGDRVEAHQQRAPGLVAESGRMLGRIDDVAEEDRRQHAVGFGGRTIAVRNARTSPSSASWSP
jgi:hypothetical protein